MAGMPPASLAGWAHRGQVDRPARWVCKAYRMELTKFGLWIGRAVGQEYHGEAARLAEELGFGALWLGSSPRLPQLRAMLAASERIVIATGIVNIWAYDP